MEIPVTADMYPGMTIEMIVPPMDGAIIQLV
jgi:hypothetical protein